MNRNGKIIDHHLSPFPTTILLSPLADLKQKVKEAAATFNGFGQGPEVAPRLPA